MKVLAVVGAAAIGALLVGALVRRLGRWLIFRDVPRPVLLLFRGLGGFAAGLAAWVMVSSPGGSGLFGGGGTVFGGRGTGSDAGKQTVRVLPSTSPGFAPFGQPGPGRTNYHARRRGCPANGSTCRRTKRAAHDHGVEDDPEGTAKVGRSQHRAS